MVIGNQKVGVALLTSELCSIIFTVALFTGCGGDDNQGKSPDDTSSETGDDDTDDSDNDDSSKDPLCEDFVQAFQECGVFTDGDMSCGMLVDYTPCQVECFVDADCGDLEKYACEDEEPDCVEECADAVFTCEDGDTVPWDFECDGEPDCDDESDEHDDCDSFSCESGDQEISLGYECDGEEDCDDGSDEHDDCLVFTCESGDEELPGSYECDLEEDCEDGSDEHDGCAALECK